LSFVYSLNPILMKKAAFLILAIVALSSTSCVIDGWDNHISGNGEVVEDARDISGFTGIHLSSGIDVLLSEGNEFKVVVEADENLVDVIETELRGNTLVVGTDNVSIRKAKSKKVK
jgi:hypothetical protein